MKTKTFSKLFTFMRGARWLYIIGVIGFSLLVLLFQVQIALLFLQLFNAIQSGSLDDVLGAIIQFSIILLIIIAVIPIFAYLTAKAAIKTTGALRRSVFHKLTVLPIKTFKETHSAELSSLATNDLIEVEKAYTQYFFIFAMQLISGLGAGVVMVIIEWRLAVVAFVAGLLTFIANSWYAKRLRRVSRDVQDRLGNVNTKISNILAGIHVIRVFNIQRFVLKIFEKSNQATLTASHRRVKHQATIDSINTLVFSISFAGITLFGGYLVLEGIILLGVIVAVIQLQNSVLELVQGLGGFIANMQTSLAAGDRIFAFLALEEEPPYYQTPELDHVSNQAVQFNAVMFSYDEKPTLNYLTLSVDKGQTIALVGPSGGGKSTIIKLILQFYKSDAGSIAINGKSTSNVDLSELRDAIAYVPQDAFLFNTTIKENIRYAKPSATDEDVIRAASAANAHDFIAQFDQGYETNVGEHGTKLSGGQRQRIAIARAILKDASILLLDEATSALDSESETLVQEALNKLKENRTTLIIAHRLSTIKDADQILVIDEGKVIEAGTHDALLSIEDSVYGLLYKTRQKYEAIEKA